MINSLSAKRRLLDIHLQTIQRGIAIESFDQFTVMVVEIDLGQRYIIVQLLDELRTVYPYLDGREFLDLGIVLEVVHVRHHSRGRNQHDLCLLKEENILFEQNRHILTMLTRRIEHHHQQIGIILYRLIGNPFPVGGEGTKRRERRTDRTNINSSMINIGSSFFMFRMFLAVADHRQGDQQANNNFAHFQCDG